MSLSCPACTSSSSLKIEQSIELPPDSRSDEIRVQVLRCTSCDFTGVGVYEESRRGSFDSDTFDHYGFFINPSEWQVLSELIKTCPTPRDKRCSCAAHQALGIRDFSSGRWSGLGQIRRRNSFSLRL